MHKSSQWWDRPATETFSYPPEVPGLTERTRAVLQQRWGGSISEPGGSAAALGRFYIGAGQFCSSAGVVLYRSRAVLHEAKSVQY